MPEISESEVSHVANLAKLALSEEELERLRYELSRIWEYFQQLQQLPTDEVPATSHAIAMENVYRGDEVGRSLTVEDVVANAPDRADEFFRVPRIIEE